MMAEESGAAQRDPPELDEEEEAPGTDSDTEGEDIFTGARNHVQPKNSSRDYFQKDEPTATSWVHVESLTCSFTKPYTTKELSEGLLPENCAHINKPGTPSKQESVLPPKEASNKSQVKEVVPPEPKHETPLETSKENGLFLDDDDQDIFAESTVKLSVDSTQSSQKDEPPLTTPMLIAAASAPPKQNTYEELEEEEQEDQFDLTIRITDPEKIGDGMNAYVAYQLSTRTNMPMFRSKNFTVKRRFSDFLGLYEKLCEKHSQNGYIIAPPPEKSLIGMTKVKVGKEDSSSAEFLERRRSALERYLQRIVSHPTLIQDPDVREFLEKDELPRAVSTQALSGAGLLKMFNRATDAVNKMTIKMNESDVWFEDKFQEVECEEQHLRKLHAVVETLVNHRKELAMNTAQFAKSLAMLGSSEDNTALSRALSQLAEVEEKIEQLHQEQANSDFYLLAELLADYIRLLSAVRGAFDQRMKTWQRWQDAQATLQKKRENEARLLWANKPDKLQQAKDEIAEWESKVTQYEREFERISVTVRKEVMRFEKEKSKDFKSHIVKYLETLLNSQHKLSAIGCQTQSLYTKMREVSPVHTERCCYGHCSACQVLGGIFTRSKGYLITLHHGK